MTDEATSKRFFKADDAGDAYYVIVATDLDHAKSILRNSGIEFGDPSVPFDRADLAWKEIPAERARCMGTVDDDDGLYLRPHRPLALRPVGAWFSSEW